jgi:hypothetical protein
VSSCCIVEAISRIDCKVIKSNRERSHGYHVCNIILSTPKSKQYHLSAHHFDDYKLDDHTTHWSVNRLLNTEQTLSLGTAVMLNIAKRQYSILAQSAFFLTNVAGILLGVVYAQKTPGLYVAQKHGRIGCVSTFVALAWIAGSSIPVLLQKKNERPRKQECAARRRSSPDTCDTALEHHAGYSSYRSSSELADLDEDEEERGLVHQMTPTCFFASKRGFRSAFGVVVVVSSILTRLILIFGFFCVTTGAVVYGGIFVSLAKSIVLDCTADR